MILSRWLPRLTLIIAFTLTMLMIISALIGRMTSPPMLTFIAPDSTIFYYDVQRQQRVPLSHTPPTGDLLHGWSANGRYLAYAHTVTSPSPVTINLYVFDAWHKTSTRIVEGLGPSTITWSPDSTRLLYVTNTGEAAIYTVADDSYTRYGVNVAHAAWSPVDERIAVVQYVDEQHWLIVDDPDSTSPRRLLRMATTSAPRWSPDGRYIMIYSGTNLLGEPRLTLIETHHGVIREYDSVGTEPRPIAWRSEASVYYGDAGDSRLYALDLDSGAVESLETDMMRYAFPPQTSSDGAWLAAVPLRVNGQPVLETELYIRAADPPSRWRLVARTNRFMSFAWRP